MRIAFHLALITLAAVLADTVSFGQRRPIREHVDVGLITASELGKRVAEVNRAWLQPNPRHLAYTVHRSPLKKGTAISPSVDRVWLADDKARWEMTFPRSRDGDGQPSYVLVVTGDHEQYLVAPKPEMVGKTRASRVTQPLTQAITWRTSLHALAQDGWQEHASIVEKREVKGGHVLVLEADFGETRRKVGLGLYHLYNGQTSAPIGKVRIHIRVPEFIPIKEEFLEHDVCVEYDASFLMIGDQVAPQIIRHIAKLPSRRSEWILEAQFQNVDDCWVLKKAYNIQDGDAIIEMVVSDVSTDRVDPDLFQISER